MGVLSGNPKEEPMHYGEVYSTWSFLLKAKGFIASYQTQINHAGDGDLKKLLKEAIQASEQEVKEIETLLKNNGVGLPPAPPDRPKAKVEDIPDGAHITDPEIAAMLAANLAAGLVTCSTIMGESIREDIATKFGEFHTQKATLSMKVLRTSKEKGWIVPPPLHHYKVEK